MSDRLVDRWDDPESIFKIADDFYSRAAASTDEEGDVDYGDEVEVSKFFKKTLADYRRVVRACEHEGLGVINETDEYKEEFVASDSVSNRLKLIADIQSEIKTMMGACDRPPRDILNKYSEDLVSRIEDGVIDDALEVEEED
jgi:hypothetical protein